MRFIAASCALMLAALAVACSSAGGASRDEASRVVPTATRADALPSAAVAATSTFTAPAPAPSSVAEPSPAGAAEPSPRPAPPTAPPAPRPTSTPAPPPPPPPPATQAISVTARDLAFGPRSLSARAGVPLTITLSNQDVGVRHDITLFAPGGGVIARTDIIEGPASASTTFTPTPGTYPFKCSVHFAMTGALSVQ